MRLVSSLNFSVMAGSSLTAVQAASIIMVRRNEFCLKEIPLEYTFSSEVCVEGTKSDKTDKMVIVGETFHIHDFGVEIHSRNEGDAGNSLESFHNGSYVRVLCFFAELFENILIVFTDFFELENQILECKIAGSGVQM